MGKYGLNESVANQCVFKGDDLHWTASRSGWNIPVIDNDLRWCNRYMFNPCVSPPDILTDDSDVRVPDTAVCVRATRQADYATARW